MKMVSSRYCPGFEAFKIVYERLAYQQNPGKRMSRRSIETCLYLNGLLQENSKLSRMKSAQHIVPAAKGNIDELGMGELGTSIGKPDSGGIGHFRPN
jgi:hypothetical protein